MRLLLTLVSVVDKRYRRLFFNYLLYPLLLPVRLLTRSIYTILFARMDSRRSAIRQKRLELEIRETFHFLFEDYGAVVVRNVDIPFPEPFDYATVTVTAGNLLMRIVRGREELAVDLARATNAKAWYDLKTVLAALRDSQRPKPVWPYDLREAATMIRANILELYDRFGEFDDRVRCRLEEFEQHDQAAIRDWEFRISSRLP